MRAVRVTKRGTPAMMKMHWLKTDDPFRTVCGRPLEALGLLQHMDVERLSSSEACLTCVKRLP